MDKQERLTRRDDGGGISVANLPAALERLAAEMPESCFDCRHFRYDKFPGSACTITSCELAERTIEDSDTERPAWCPLGADAEAALEEGGDMSDVTHCPVCGMAEPVENRVSVWELFCPYSYEVDVQIRAYPHGGYTLIIWNQEGSSEIPLNFCPECGRDLRRKDGERGEWIDTGDGGTHCSVCGHDSEFDPTPFCPKCGARMAQAE